MEGIGGNLEEMRRVPLADMHVEQIRAIAQERHYADGDIVARVGQPMDEFVYVLDGGIEVVDAHSGERPAYRVRTWYIAERFRRCNPARALPCRGALYRSSRARINCFAPPSTMVERSVRAPW